MKHPNIYQDYLAEKVQQMNEPKTHLNMDNGYYVISRIKRNGKWLIISGTFELNEELNLWIATWNGTHVTHETRLHSKTISGLKQMIRREFKKIVS